MNRWRVNTTTARLLNKLVREGYLTRSSLSKGAMSNVELLIEQGILGRESKRIVIRRPDDLNEIIQGIITPPKKPDHAEAARYFGDAHRGGRQPKLALLLRTRGKCQWRQLNTDIAIEASVISDTMGVASLAINPNDHWYCDQPLAFVENEYCLWHCETFPLPEDVTGVILYNGNADKRLLDWLTYRQRAPQIFWCPDYDYVGLNNYMRAKSKANIRLWVPDQLEALLNSPANNPQRLKDQKKLLPNLLKNGDSDVQRVLRLLLSSGGGTDHEAFIE